MNVRKRVDVIIPVYRPDKKFARLLRMLALQTYPVNRIIVMNTERSYWNDGGFEGIKGLEVHHLTREELTRDLVLPATGERGFPGRIICCL